MRAEPPEPLQAVMTIRTSCPGPPLGVAAHCRAAGRLGRKDPAVGEPPGVQLSQVHRGARERPLRSHADETSDGEAREAVDAFDDAEDVLHDFFAEPQQGSHLGHLLLVTLLLDRDFVWRALDAPALLVLGALVADRTRAVRASIDAHLVRLAGRRF